MEDSYPHVFSPFRLGGFDLRNRLVALPAGTSLVEGGVPTHGDVEHFERLAQGGVGLIIAGAMVVHPTSALRSGKLVEGYLDAVVPAMTEKADVVHRHGARLVGQLVHLGREFIGGESDQPPMAPSPIKTARDAYPPHELTVAEIDDIIEGWRVSTENLVKAGLDGVEIHAAHGYLPAPVHVAADQPADRQLRRLLREPDALPAPGHRGDALGQPGGVRAGRPAQRRGGDPRRHGHRRLRADRRGPGRAGRRRLLQHHPRHPRHLRQGLHRPGRRRGPVRVAGPRRDRRAHPGRPADPRRGHRRARHQGRPRRPGRHGAGPDRRPGPAGQVADRSARRDPRLPGHQPGLPRLRPAPALRGQRRGRARATRHASGSRCRGPRRST